MGDYSDALKSNAVSHAVLYDLDDSSDYLVGRAGSDISGATLADWGASENNADACRVLAACYDALHQPRFALRALLEGLSYGRPRAELCCDIAARFYALQDYRQAIWWYERALDCPRPGETGGFVSPDCYGYLPCIQLCLCWYALGEAARAAAYNERAGEYKPEDPAYLYNKAFFEARQ